MNVFKRLWKALLGETVQDIDGCIRVRLNNDKKLQEACKRAAMSRNITVVARREPDGTVAYYERTKPAQQE